MCDSVGQKLGHTRPFCQRYHNSGLQVHNIPRPGNKIPQRYEDVKTITRS